MNAVQDAVERVYREEYGRVLATLIRQVGDISLAEDALQDALASALESWQTEVPDRPAAWITTTARRKAIDRLRRAATFARKQEILHYLAELEANEPELDIDTVLHDDQLRLIFTCCHPALAQEAQVALTLRTLGGLKTPEIAKAFLVPEATMAQRIVRAKRKIREANIPYRVPPDHDLVDRLASVLGVLYLIFNEGYVASSGDSPMRSDLSSDAIRLGAVLADLMPDEPEVMGLLALMMLHHARRAARFDGDSRLVLLGDQDRSLWDSALIDAGAELVERSLRRRRIGPYQLQAAIAAVHCQASSAEGTDWREIVLLYDKLFELLPTPVVALNRAVAVAMHEGPDAGLLLMEQLEEPLAGYHLLHSAKADLLRRSGRKEAAADAYRIALDLTENPAQREFLSHRLEQLANDGELGVESAPA